MNYLKVPRGEVHYTTSGGEGPWVTLVNGHTRPITDFRSMIKYLNSKGFRVVCGDNRGAGLTKWQGDFSLSDMVNDILEVHRHVGISSSHFVGLSMGGIICQKLGIDFPELVDRLILISTSPSAAMIQGDNQPWPDSLDGVFDKLSSYFSEDFVRANQALVKAMAKQMYQGFQESSSNAAAGTAAQRQALDGFDLQRDLGGLEIPTKIIHGSIDHIVPLKAGQRLAELIPGAQLEVYEGAGHLLLAERARTLFESIGGFLGQASD